MIDGYILTSASFITCPHGGKFVHRPTYAPNILIDGSPMCLEGDPFYISCPLGSNDGCSRIRWEYDTSGILYLNKPNLTTSSRGKVINAKGLTIGSPIYLAFQTKITLRLFIELNERYHAKKQIKDFLMNICSFVFRDLQTSRLID